MRITMPRGDIRNVQFTIRDMNGNIVTTDFTEIYITCKKRCTDKVVCFQKTLSDQTIEKVEDGVYRMTIEPDDTNYLEFGNYVFDIQLDYEDMIKQTTVGILTLTDEVTNVEDEYHGG